MSHPPTNRSERWFWWLGVPLLAALCTWGPYWLRALFLGHRGWFWIPLVGDATFDTAAYLQPVGHAALGIPEAALIGPFAHLIRVLAVTFPHESVAELWLMTRWMSAVASIWIGAWAVRQWTGLRVRASRLISLTLWIALALVLGMKPGVFSWFLPCGLIGFAVVPIVAARLRDRRIWSAIGWSLLAFVATSVYAWYQLFILPWLAVVWFRWFASHSIKRSAIWFAIGSASAAAVMTAAGWWIATTEKGTIILELYERLSFSPTRMIFFSGSVLMTMLWIPLLLPLLKRFGGRDVWSYRIDLMFSAWVTLLLVFFHSPFTGHYIQNDHFRSAAAICAWLSLVLLWNLFRHVPSASPISKQERWLILVPGIIAGIFTLKILAAPYAWNGDQINIIQLTHWFALCVAAWLTWQWTQESKTLNVKTFALILTCASLFIGGNAWAAALTHEFKEMKSLERLQPLWSWTKENVKPTDALCTDHGGDTYSLDDQLSAITGRVVHFAHTTLYHKERNDGFLGRMKTVAGFYDVTKSGDLDYWKLQATLNQFIVCDQFPMQTKLLLALGISQTKIDELTSCPRQKMDAWWAPIQDAIDHPRPDEQAFKTMCPYVVIPERSKPYWHLPPGYVEHPVMSDISVWSLK